MGFGQLRKLGGYQTALWLAIANALINLVGWSAIDFQYSHHLTTQVITVCAVSLAIPIGLWLQSNLIRYLGAVWMVVWAGALIWPLVSSGAVPFVNRPEQTILLMIFFSCSALLNLLTAEILVFSEKFAKEFSGEREHQPRYKKYFKWSVLATVIVAMVTATVIDIINLSTH
jgi:hypothetical protein